MKENCIMYCNKAIGREDTGKGDRFLEKVGIRNGKALENRGL